MRDRERERWRGAGDLYILRPSNSQVFDCENEMFLRKEPISKVMPPKRDNHKMFENVKLERKGYDGEKKTKKER